MDPRQPLPRRWLMTDERLGARLFEALERLPEGAGIVFRHYSLPPRERRALFDAVRASRPDSTLLLGGPAEQARSWGADGSHGRGSGEGLRTSPAHDLAELEAADAAGADLVFLSPVFPTRSHPGVPAVGPHRFAELAQRTRVPVVALGGMTEARFRTLAGAYGWAGIDAWLG